MRRESPVKTALLMTVSLVAGALMTIVFLQAEYISFTSFREPLTLDDLAAEVTPVSRLSTHNHTHHPGKAVQETQKVRVLCWVLTRPEMHHSSAVNIKATWGSRCDKLIFMNSENDTQLGAIDLGVGEGREELWSKTMAAFTYVYNNYLSQYDWFFKADDDTYAIMENMRYMLSAYDPNFPIYFGSMFRKFSKHGYMSGGGGYVFSRKAVKKLVEEGFANECGRTHSQNEEDVVMGTCLENIGVYLGDSRDSLGRGRFFERSHTTYLLNEVSDWYFNLIYYKADTGLHCCSDSAISFHNINPRKMYEMEYLLYHLRPHGVSTSHPVPLPLPPDHHSIPPQALLQ